MNRYAVLGIAVIMVTGTFLLFSDYNGPGAYDYTGIVSDVHESTSGFVFVLNPDGHFTGVRLCYGLHYFT